GGAGPRAAWDRARAPAGRTCRRCPGSRPRVEAVLDEVVLDSGGGVAEPAGAGLEDAGDLLFLPVAEEGRALHRPQLGADAHRGQVVADRLRDARVRRVARVLAGVEAVGIAGLGQQFLRPRGIVRVGRNEQRVLEGAGDDAAGRLGVPQRLRLVDRVLVEGERRRPAYAPVVPGRFR